MNRYSPRWLDLANALSDGRRLAFMTVLACVLGIACLRAGAQEAVATDPRIDGFELFRKGIHWWAGPGHCSGIPNQATIRFQPTAPGTSYTQARSCLILQGTEYDVVRDDLQFYFFSEGQLHHKAVWDSTAAPSTVLSTYPDTPTLSDQVSTPLDLAGGYLYWGKFMPSVGWNIFSRMKTDALRSPEGVAVIFDGASPVLKLKVFSYYDSAAGKSIDALLALLRNGKLYRCKFTTGTGELLATDVTDFAVHTRYLLLASPVTSIYAAQGTLVPTSSSPPGQVIRMDADTLLKSTIFTASDHNQVIAVTTDSDQFIPFFGDAGGPRNIYVTEAVVGGCPSCVFARGDIFKHVLPYTGGAWTSVISTFDGSNLRSDDEYLYYREAVPGAVSIMRIPAAAGPYEFDYEADGLEVVQASQDLNNSFRLVQNRTTLARGYARLIADSTGKIPQFPTARLRGWDRNGAELPGSPLVPLNSPPIDMSTSLEDRRADRNRSFLFLLPDSWVRGRLSLRMEVNPFRIQRESGSADPYANNVASVSPGLEVTLKSDPCLKFVPILTKAPLFNVYASDSGVWDILERARSLLPVNDFKLFPSSVYLAKPVVHACWDVPPWCTSLEPFNLPDDDSTALFWLWSLDKLSKDPPCASGDVHWVGAIHGSTPGKFAGLGKRPGKDLIAQMYLSGTAPWTTPLGGRILAHELGHNYDRRHINQFPTCGEKAPDGPYDSYPYNPCTIGPVSGPTAVFGFDPMTWSVIRPTDAGELMTYSPNRWISRQTWDALFGIAPASGEGGIAAALNQAADGAPANVPLAPPVLFIHGVLQLEQNRAQLLPFYVLPTGAADAGKVAESFAAAAQIDPQAPLQVRLLDAAGTPLVVMPIVTVQDADAEHVVTGVAQFVPYNPATRRVQLVNGAQVLAERIPTEHAPTLALQPPVPDAANEGFQLNWSASDSDNDPLLFTVQYSTDGDTWEALTTGYPWLSFHAETHSLAGSSRARFRVIATDGFNTALATSEVVNIPGHSPQARIGGVRDHQRIRFGEPVHLRGGALDAEDGSLPDDRLNWNISGPTGAPATSGSSVTLTDLAPGTYHATLQAFDSENNAGQAEISWEVLLPAIPESQTPELDGEPNDAGYANALAFRVSLGGADYARALLLHSGSDLYLFLGDLPLPPNAQLPPAVGWRVDADQSGGQFGSQGDLGFFVNADGLLWEEVGTGQGMIIPTQPMPGFAAVIRRGATAWSAELRIADSLVGGWNHQVGVMLDLGSAQWPPFASGAVPSTWAPVWLGATTPTPANRAPIASAGAAQFVNVADETAVFLDGGASFDPDSDALVFNWIQVAGPSVQLLEASTSTPRFLAPSVAAATPLRFQLMVGDGQLTSNVSETEVTLLPTARPAHMANSGFPQARMLDGQLAMRLFGEPGQQIIVEATSDFAHWDTVFSGTADFFGVIDFMAQDVANQEARFYRALPVLNDSFRNRFPLGGTSNTVFSLNRFATREPSEPAHAGNSGGASIWFSWTAPATGTATVSTTGSGVDTLLALYVGDFLGQLQLIAADDDSGGNATSHLTFTAQAGVTYQIAVDGYGGATGPIQLNVSMP
jgi:hypothetical protein